MSEKFQDKYRTGSVRLKGWDYRNSGYYFITICTHKQEEFFGSIKEGNMILSDAGKIAADEWLKTATIRKNVSLDEWIIMPNHIHGIIRLNNDFGNVNDAARRDEALPRLIEKKPRLMEKKKKQCFNSDEVGKANGDEAGKTDGDEVGKTDGDEAEKANGDEAPPRLYDGNFPEMSAISPKSNSISSIIGSFKSIVTKTINKKYPELNFGWQPKFYDHIIRNEQSLNRIQIYIRKNPLNWDKDEYNF